MEFIPRKLHHWTQVGITSCLDLFERYSLKERELVAHPSDALPKAQVSGAVGTGLAPSATLHSLRIRFALLNASGYQRKSAMTSCITISTILETLYLFFEVSPIPFALSRYISHNESCPVYSINTFLSPDTTINALLVDR